MGLELRNRLERALGMKLSASTVWNFPTANQLSAYLAEQLGLTNPPAARSVGWLVNPSPPQPKLSKPSCSKRRPCWRIYDIDRASSIRAGSERDASHERRSDRATRARAAKQLPSCASGSPMHKRPGAEQIAIVGMACRFPGEARDCDGYWRMAVEGRDAMHPIPPARARHGATDLRPAALLEDIETFDAGFLRYFAAGSRCKWIRSSGSSSRWRGKRSRMPGRRDPLSPAARRAFSLASTITAAAISSCRLRSIQSQRVFRDWQRPRRDCGTPGLRPGSSRP